MKCESCKEVEIQEQKFCCSGYMCGCMGLPVDPPYCEKCWEEIMIRSERNVLPQGHQSTEST